MSPPAASANLYSEMIADDREGPAGLFVIGNRALLEVPLTGLLSSVDTPPDLILPTLDLAFELRRLAAPVVGGFQVRIEARCLEILLNGELPVVICPARSLRGMRIPRAWLGPLDSGRLAIASYFPEREQRVSASLGTKRNDLIVSLSSRLIVVHARPGGRTMAAAAAALARGIPVHCFAHPRNRDLLLRGARPVEAGLGSLPDQVSSHSTLTGT